MHEGTCHCKAVRLSIPSVPEHLTNCNCSICWRYGALWAYFVASSVQLVDEMNALETYSWGLKDLRFFRCRHCGVVTHWEKSNPSRGSLVGVNMRNFEMSTLAGAKVLAVDGRTRGRRHFDDA